MSQTLRRARPTHALGGTPRKDHLFGEDDRSLCDSWMFGGGRQVERDEIEADGDLCRLCARQAGVIDA